MKEQKGFTLIELLLVLTIIGIISAIAIPALLGRRESARNRATAANALTLVGAIQTAVDICENGDYPAGQRPVTDLQGLPQTPTLTAIIQVVLARPQVSATRNPFDATQPCYSPVAGDAAAIGQVGWVVEAYLGQTVCRITFGLSVNRVFTLKTIDKRVESVLAV